MNYIEKALEKTTDTKALIIGKGVIKDTPKMFKQLFGDRKAVIVSDKKVYGLVGEKLENYIKEANIELEESFVFQNPKLFAEWSFLEELEAYLKDKDVIAIGLGSGVINDLTKLVSEHLGRRYMIVGTAASMDGYTAYGASITYKGNKQTFDCKAPLGVVFDPEVAVMANDGQSASGYADLIAKVPAGADWMLADFLGVEKIDKFAFDLVQSKLKESLSKPDAVAQGDINATEELAEGLIMSGFAMQACQSSRPASGMEHQFSHYWDMADLHYNGHHVSHGFKVGIGTLVSTASWEFLLNYDVSKLDIDKAVAMWPSWEEQKAAIEKMFADMPGHKERGLTETKNKYQDKETIKSQLVKLKEGWAEFKPQIEEQLFPYDKVYDYLKRVGAPYKPEMIGVDHAYLKKTFLAIQYMRSRFTIIDLIVRAGLLDELTDYLFGKGGKWEV